MDELRNPTGKMNLFYRAYGLNIRSSLGFTELLERPGSDFDADFVLGEIPRSLADTLDSGLRYQASRMRLLLTIDGVARFLILNGERILIEPYSTADESAIRLFLLGSAVSSLLHQREKLVLRGSAIDFRGSAVAFLGAAGVGKSTIVASLVQKGYPLLTDDLCVIKTNPDGQHFIQSGFPQVSLWPDVLRELQVDPDKLRPIRKGLKKKALPLTGSFTRDALPIRKIYILRSVPNNDVQISNLNSLEAFAALEARSHLTSVLKGMGVDGTYRQMALSFSQKGYFSIMTRPRRKALLRNIINKLEADF